MPAPHIMLLTTAPRRVQPWIEAAEKLGFPCIIAGIWLEEDPRRGTALRLDPLQRDSVLRIVEQVERTPLAAIVPTEPLTAPLAARAASMLKLPFHPPKAADACVNNALLCQKLAAAGIPVADPNAPPHPRDLLIPAVLEHGRLRLLGLLLESLEDEHATEVHPSRLSPQARRALGSTLHRSIQALALRHGPFHATVRFGESSFEVIDFCASPVGPAYSPALRFYIPLVEQDISLEEVVLRVLLGSDISRIRRHVDQHGC